MTHTLRRACTGLSERLKFWNQYGCQPDVFRQYGEAVRRSNQGTLQVVSMIAVIGSIVTGFLGFA